MCKSGIRHAQFNGFVNVKGSVYTRVFMCTVQMESSLCSGAAVQSDRGNPNEADREKLHSLHCEMKKGMLRLVFFEHDRLCCGVLLCNSRRLACRNTVGSKPDV